jgi:hypothetical protein
MLNRKVGNLAVTAITIVSTIVLTALAASGASASAMPATNLGHASVTTVAPATLASANASATPDTTLPQCDTVYELWSCVQVFGSGLHIDRMNGWAHNDRNQVISGSFWNELYYDHDNVRPGDGTGYRGILNCSFLSLPPGGNTANCDWAPNANEAQGYYCDAIWQSIRGRPGLWAYRCVYVHS